MSCTTLLPRRWDPILAPGASRRLGIDFSREFASRWGDKPTRTIGEKIRAGGYDAVCSGAGRRGASEPSWPEEVGAPVQDGSITWQIVAPSDASLITTIASTSWDPPTGISIGGKADGVTDTSAMVTIGDAVEAGEYTITVTVTCADGEIYIQPCILEVEA